MRVENFFLRALIVSAEVVYCGRRADVRTENVLTIYGLLRIHTIKRIQTSRQENYGAIGISPENRRTGVVEVCCILKGIARISLSIMDAELRNVSKPQWQSIKTDIFRAHWWKVLDVKPVTKNLRVSWIFRA